MVYTKHWALEGLMLGQRLRCWPIIKPALVQLWCCWDTQHSGGGGGVTLQVVVVQYCLQGLYAYDIVEKARWADLSTSHHIKPEPIGEGMMWWMSAEISPSRRTSDAVCIFVVQMSIWNGEIKLISEAKRRNCEIGLPHHTSHSESQQHECDKLYYSVGGSLSKWWWVSIVSMAGQSRRCW